MPSYLITGAKGQLGQCFHSIQKEFPQHQLFFAASSEVDVTRNETLRAYHDKHPFDGIINCAAYTQVDKSESAPEQAQQRNVEGVKTLIQFTEAKGVKLIHFSTDFVFDGQKKGAYLEEDPSYPLNRYGQSKREGELYLAQALCPAVCFRVSWLFSPFGNNFVKTLLQTSQVKSVVKVVDDQFGKPTYGIDLARAVLGSLEHPNLFTHKTYHFAQGPQTSWYDFAQKIIEVAGSPWEVEPIPSAAYPAPAIRPHCTSLDTQRIEKTLSLNLRNWESALKECIQQIQKNESL
jgi:dTDP-4-dehydrorhamnose reductase